MRLCCVYRGDASCSVSAEFTTPPLPADGALNKHESPAGIVAGHENVRDFGSRMVEPLGVTVMVTLPVALGAIVTEAGFTDVLNDAARVTMAAVALAAV